jgi:hypothetical protein
MSSWCASLCLYLCRLRESSQLQSFIHESAESSTASSEVRHLRARVAFMECSSYSCALRRVARRSLERPLAVRRWTCDALTLRRCYVERPWICAVMIGRPCNALGSQCVVPRAMMRDPPFGTALTRSKTSQTRLRTAHRLSNTQTRCQVQDGNQIGKARAKSCQQSGNQRRALFRRLSRTLHSTPGSLIGGRQRARGDCPGRSHEAE